MRKTIMTVWAVLSAVAGAKEPANTCVVRMGYKPYPKKPYMFQDDRGIYRDVYGEALKRIGCSLVIERLPKRRIIQRLKKGTIDFYPIFAYTKERAAYTYFIPNRLPNRAVVVTREDIPPLHSLQDLIRYKPILLKEIGGYSPMEAIPGKRFETTDVNIAKAFNLLLYKRIDAFSMQDTVTRYYLKEHPEIKGVSLHPGLFPNIETKTLGFSRHSPHFHEWPNPDYDPLQPVSPTNPMTLMETNTTAYRFARSLEELERDGTTQKIIERYTKR